MKEALPIGLIAGNGRFPILIAQAARQAGRRMVAVAHLGETQPELEPWVESHALDSVGRIRQAGQNL